MRLKRKVICISLVTYCALMMVLSLGIMQAMSRSSACAISRELDEDCVPKGLIDAYCQKVMSFPVTQRCAAIKIFPQAVIHKGDFVVYMPVPNPWKEYVIRYLSIVETVVQELVSRSIH